MNILAIETSCDETAVAVIRDGRHILANVISSQIKLHQQYGGVVPELASREHIVNIAPVLQTALARSGLAWDEIDAIAVTRGPGLAGALLVGVNTGKALAFALDKPFVGINHMEGHIYSNWLIPEEAAPAPAARPAPGTPPTVSPAPPPPAPSAEELPWQGRRLVGYGQAASTPAPSPSAPAASIPVPTPNPQPPTPSTDPQFPLIALVVSGGHTELLYMTGHGEYQMLGRTIDDAAGEAFDKVARILGLGYPGGPAIQRAAEKGDPAAFEFPHSVMRGTFDFSFSGLKTAVLRKVNEFGPPLPAAPPPPAPVEAVSAPVAATPAPATPPPAPPAPAPAGTTTADERPASPGEEPDRPPVRMLGTTAATRPPVAPPPVAEEEDEDLEEEDEELAPPAPTRPAPNRPATPPPAAREPAAPPSPPRPPARSTTPPPAPTPRPATGTPAETATPRRATPSPSTPAAPTEPERPTPPRRTPSASTGPGLIRVESERPTAQPLPTPPPPEPIPPAPKRSAPRVLGTEGERPAGPDPELPAFLQRGTQPPRPTSIRSRQRPAEPEVPAFLRDRSTPPPTAAADTDEEEELRTPRSTPTGRSATPPPRTPPAPPTPARPSPPPPSATPPRSAEPPARSTPTRPATPPPPTPQRRDPVPPAQPPTVNRPTPRSTEPPPAPTRPTPRSTEPPAAPPRRTTRPSDEDEEIPIRPAPRTPPPAPRTPIRPVPKPQPLAEREIQPMPKSVQAGRPANDEDEDIDLDDEDSLASPPPRRNQLWSDWLEDIIDGEDDNDQPPPPRRRPVPLEGPRRPDASVRLPGSGKPTGGEKEKPPLPVADIAAAFQDAAVDILVEKTVLAVATYRARTVLLAGGVAANRPLRERLRERLGPDIDLRYPPLIFCTDNAAMIAAAAFFRYDDGLQTDWSLDIDPNARYWE